MKCDTTFRVLVDVIEIQNVIWPNPSENVKSKLPNPLVEVVIADQCHSTSTREATASCTFNRTFLFLNIQVAENLQASVYHKGFFGKKELIGSCRIQLSTVRSTNEHRILRAFYTLVHPEKPSEPRGFLRLSIHVLKAGEFVRSVETGTLSSILKTSTRSLTQAVQKETSQLTFDVYHFTVFIHFGQDILKKLFLFNELLPSSYVQVDFMGTKLKTPVCRETYEPKWSIGLRFPATVPCANDTVTIELWSDGTTSTRQSFIKLSFLHLLKLTKSTRWINFYTEDESIHNPSREEMVNPLTMLVSLFELDDDQVNANEKAADLKYLGRVLISTLVEKKKSSSVAVTVPGLKIVSPLDQKVILWMDLFLLCGVPKHVDISITIGLGDWETRVKMTERVDDCLRFNEEQGRIVEQAFFLPANLEMANDLIIQIFGHRKRGSTTLLAKENASQRLFLGYSRIPVISLVKRDNVPFWIKFINVESEWIRMAKVLDTSTKKKTCGSFSMSLLASVVLRTAEEMQNKTTRPSRLQCNIERYICHIICYQVVNLPVLPNAFPDPYIVVSLGGGSAKTQTILSTLQPDFYEMLTFYLSLPEHVKLSRELWIQVFSKNCLLGETSIPVDFLLSDAALKPQWYPLTCQQFEDNQSRILCSIHLTCLTNQTLQFVQELPKTIRWFPIEYQPYDVKLFLIGCRLLPNAAHYLGENIQVQIEFGRDTENLNRRLWYGSCEKIVQESGGNVNFFSQFHVKCFLPTSELFQTFIEFHVSYLNNDECYEIGIAYLHLTPEMKRFSSKLREQIKSEFEYFSPFIEEIIPWKFQPQTCSNPSFLSPCVNLSKIWKTLPHDSEFEIVQNAWSAEKSRDETSVHWPSYDLKDLKKREANSYKLYTSDVDVFCSSDTQKLRQTIPNSKYLESMKHFVWCDAPDKIDKTDNELNYPVEWELPLDDLPYNILPIFSPDGMNAVVGNPGVVGLLKLHCAVLTADEDTTNYEKHVDKLRKQLSTGPLKVRVHVKNATGLCTSANDEGEWFLVVKYGYGTPKTNNKINEIKDVYNTRKGLAPDFYRSFELDAEFPQNAILTIGISTVNTSWSSFQIVGQTYIDLENRFFHPNFKFLTTNHENPVLVETRCLRDLTNNETVGHIRLWVEILTDVEACAAALSITANKIPGNPYLKLCIF
ncbi:uncharacterized protein LOC128883859 isoform X2 [Hylaeus volcanicus]|uniref:uncharacterized protein LOC128883859 isoform X2 n=1 Tax=Hylaeus volcanicus TaxID=313075 RepID=UPI0023B864B8|nr:uncharacterized protein LOC128883859 isoform X2 [Hylaeus volcanicus]